jgi:hypothetical protein
VKYRYFRIYVTKLDIIFKNCTVLHIADLPTTGRI